jgi:hypothetical protein
MSWSEPAAWTSVAATVLERLAEDSADWMVLKHHERLPEVTGDIDLCVAREEWDRTLGVIAAALGDLGEFAITDCDHWPHVRLTFTTPLHIGDVPTRILQIDLIDGVLWRGVQLAPATALLADHRIAGDPGEIPPARSSAGLRAALFLTYAVQASGRLSAAALAAEGVEGLAREDPEGFVQAMRRCHGRVGTRSARHFLAGTWKRHEGLALHARRLLRQPADHLRLGRASIERRRRGHWRRISRDLPRGLSEWMSVHASGHRVSETRAAGGVGTPTSSGPRGQVALVGPDGVGKSTIANLLIAEAQRRGSRTQHAHWRPRLLMAQSDHGVIGAPHASAPHGAVKSVLKLGAVLLDNLVGAVGPWRHARRHGLLVVERGWYDQVIDPLRYRFAATVAPVALALGTMVPRADLVVVLSGDPAVVAARKHELEPAEVERHLEAWTELAPRAGRRVLVLDTEALDPAACVAEIVRALAPARSWCRVPIAPRRLSMRVAPGASLAAALAIYEPSGRWARQAVRANIGLVRRGLALPSTAPLARLGALCDRLDVRPDSVGAFRSTADDRFVIGLAAAGELAAFLKVGPLTDAGLRREAEVLDRWRGRPAPSGIPTLRWAGEWEGHFVLATDAVAGRRGDLDVEQVLPLVNQLTTGGISRLPRVHGDLAPWNVLVTPAGPVLVDWEESRDEAEPMFDLAHFVTQQGAMLHCFAPDTAVRLLTEPGSAGWRHLEAVGAAPADAADLVRSYLDRTKRFSTPNGHRYRQLMRDALR